MYISLPFLCVVIGMNSLSSQCRTCRAQQRNRINRMNSAQPDNGPASSLFTVLVRPQVFALLLGAYWLLHYGMRLGFSDTFQIDGAEQVYLSQWLRWDYGNLQPPALTWFFWALWQVLDPSLWSFVLVRYLMLGLAFWIWYRIACCLFSGLNWRRRSVGCWLVSWVGSYIKDRRIRPS